MASVVLVIKRAMFPSLKEIIMIKKNDEYPTNLDFVGFLSPYAVTVTIDKEKSAMKRNMVVAAFVFLCAALILGPFGTAQAAVVFTNWGTGEQGGWYLDDDEWAAVGFTVPAGQDYQLNSVTIWLESPSAAETVSVELYSDNGGVPGTSLMVLGNEVVSGAITGHTYFASATLTGGTSYHVVAKGFPIFTSSLRWRGFTGNAAPGGVFAFVASTTTFNGGGAWIPAATNFGIEIDADVEGAEPADADAEPVPGCDVRITIPATAVGATMTADTPVYWTPGGMTDEVFPAGLNVRAIGVDASGAYTKVLYVCGYYWVPTGVIGPNYESPWNGAPLPTDVVD